MIDINLIRTNPELVKENMKKKFQDHKLELVDRVVELDAKFRALKQEGDNLRASRNAIIQEIGKLMKEKKIEEANATKAKVVEINNRAAEIEKQEKWLLQVGCNTYNVDIALDVIKSTLTDSEVKKT